jgi:hypothetical protein
MFKRIKLELTEYQLDTIYILALDAYEAKSPKQYEFFRRNAYAIYTALNMIAGHEVLTSEGLEVIYCNGTDNPPTIEGIQKLLENVRVFIPRPPE